MVEIFATFFVTRDTVVVHLWSNQVNMARTAVEIDNPAAS